MKTFLHCGTLNLNFITLTISIVGLIISIINAIYFFKNKKRSITIDVRSYTLKTHFQKYQLANIYLRIINHSQLPISITRIQLIIDNEKFDVSTFPQTIMTLTHHSGKEQVERQKIKSTLMPINIMSLGAYSGYLSFPILRDSLPANQKHLTFEISTNRGSSFQKTYELDEYPPLY